MARSINDLAKAVDMTPRNVRKHIRAFEKAKGGKIGEATPGKGKRYDLDAQTFSRYRKMLESRKASEASNEQEQASN